MLTLSIATAHALKALRCLGGGHCPTRQIADIARCAGVPRCYLAKVMTPLARVGLITTKRGRYGGIGLARPAEAISLLEVVEAVEGPNWMGDCLLGLCDCLGDGTCPTEALWRRIRDEIRRELARLTLADLITCQRTGRLEPFRRAGRAKSRVSPNPPGRRAHL
jgi:Rrf2 family protein